MEENLPLDHLRPLLKKIVDGFGFLGLGGSGGLHLALVEDLVGCAGRKGVEPEGDLGELDGHPVLVHPVDDAFQEDAAHNVPVVELFRIQGPAQLLGRLEDGLADRLDPGFQRRAVRGVPRPVHRGLDLAHTLQHLVCQVVHQRDQEVSAPHGRVADLEIEDARRRVKALELFEALGLGAAGAPQLRDGGLEGSVGCLEERLESRAEDEPDEVIVGVVASAGPACERIRFEAHAAVVRYRFELEQALVDGAQVLDREVPVVDPAAAVAFLPARKGVDQGSQCGVGEAHAVEERVGLEETAVVGWHTERKQLASHSGSKNRSDCTS